jgi:hypothetical protein
VFFLDALRDNDLLRTLRPAVGGMAAAGRPTARFTTPLHFAQSLYIQYTAFYGFEECNYVIFGGVPDCI